MHACVIGGRQMRPPRIIWAPALRTRLGNFAAASRDLCRRGPNKAPKKKLVSLRLSPQVLDAYKAKGPGWQSRIDEDLRRINKIK
jgi:uncharacterized protein (DUF4415 family)